MTTIERRTSVERTRERRSIREALRRDPFASAVAVLTGLYCLAVLFQLPALAAHTFSSSDSAGALVLGPYVAHGSNGILATPGASVQLGLEALTFGLSFHELLWERDGLIAMLIAFGLLIDATRVACGPRRALFVGAAAVCAAPLALEINLSLGARTVTWFCTALVCWTLIRSEVAPPRHGWRWLFTACAVAVLVGADVAGDALGFAVVVVPAFVTLVTRATWPRTSRKDLARLGVAAALLVPALIGYVAVGIAAGRLHEIAEFAPASAFGSAEQVLKTNVLLLPGALVAFANGDFFGSATKGPAALYLLDAVAIIMTALLVIPATKASVARLKEKAELEPDSDAPTFSFTLFWAAAAAATVVAYLSLSGEAYVYGGRYLIALIWAVFCLTAVASLQSTAWLRWLGMLTVIYCLAGAVAILDGAASTVLPYAKYATAIARIANRERIARGFGPYWDAAAISHFTKEKPLVAPVLTCGASLCANPFGTVESWFRPTSGPSFLITDAAQSSVAGIPSGVESPYKTINISPTVKMYLFRGDLAHHIARAQ